MGHNSGKIILTSALCFLLCSCTTPKTGGFEYSELPSQDSATTTVMDFFDPERYKLDPEAAALIEGFETGTLELSDEKIEELIFAVSKNDFYPNSKKLKMNEFDKYERGKNPQSSEELEYYPKNYNHVTDNAYLRNDDYTVSGVLNYSPYITNVAIKNSENVIIGHEAKDYSTKGTYNISYKIEGNLPMATVSRTFEKVSERFENSEEVLPLNEEFKINNLRFVDVRTFYKQISNLAKNNYWDDIGKVKFVKTESGDLEISFDGVLTTEVKDSSTEAKVTLTNITTGKAKLVISKEGFVSNYVLEPFSVRTFVPSDSEELKNKVYKLQHIEYTFAHIEMVTE